MTGTAAGAEDQTEVHQQRCSGTAERLACIRTAPEHRLFTHLVLNPIPPEHWSPRVCFIFQIRKQSITAIRLFCSIRSQEHYVIALNNPKLSVSPIQILTCLSQALFTNPGSSLQHTFSRAAQHKGLVGDTCVPQGTTISASGNQILQRKASLAGNVTCKQIIT